MVSPPQRPYQQALDCAFHALRNRPPSPLVLESLGARAVGDVIHVKALNHSLQVDRTRACVTVDGAAEKARIMWAVLVVHYLCAGDPPRDTRAVSFGAFQDGCSYASVFQKRITGRFLASIGRSVEGFVAAAERVGGIRIPGEAVGYRFNILPRVPIAIFRFEGDTELEAGASVVYQADSALLLPAEDRVVAADLLLDALAGKPITEPGGAHGYRT